jgi:hypothetical protein
LWNWPEKEAQLSKIKFLLEKNIIATLLLICIYCQPVDTTEVLIKDHNCDYAPLQIGNQWTYIDSSYYYNGRTGGTIGNFQYNYSDSLVIDTMLIMVDNIINVGESKLIILKLKQISFDSAVYTRTNYDTLILSKATIVNIDTLSITGDSIKGLYPYFNLIDYPDSCKTVAKYENSNLKIVKWNNSYYLETYGLIKYHREYRGNGHGYTSDIRLLKFNDELIDNSFILLNTNKN